MTSVFSLDSKESSTGAAVSNDTRRAGQAVNPTGLLPGGNDYTHLNAIRKSVKINYKWHLNDNFYKFIVKFCALQHIDVDKVYREDTAETTIALYAAKNPSLYEQINFIEPRYKDRIDFDVLRTHDRYNDRKSFEKVGYTYGRSNPADEDNDFDDFDDNDSNDPRRKKRKPIKKSNEPLTNAFKPRETKEQNSNFNLLFKQFADKIKDKTAYKQINNNWSTFISSNDAIDSYVFLKFNQAFKDKKLPEFSRQRNSLSTLDAGNEYTDEKLYTMIAKEMNDSTAEFARKARQSIKIVDDNSFRKEILRDLNTDIFNVDSINSQEISDDNSDYKFVKFAEEEPIPEELTWEDYLPVLTAEFYGSVENGYDMLREMYNELKHSTLSYDIDQIIRLKPDNIYDALLTAASYKYKEALRNSSRTVIYSRVNSTAHDVDQINKKVRITKYIMAT